MKHGGVIAGHDYYPGGEHWQGVHKAVEEWSKTNNIRVNVEGSSWIVERV